MKKIRNVLSLGLALACAGSLSFSAQALELPDKVCFSLTKDAGYGLPSYADTTIVLSGNPHVFDTWCLNANVQILGDQSYTAIVLTPEQAGAEGLMLNPENMDLVVYILNQDYQGKPSPSGGVYTLGDVQVAIWNLIDDEIGDDMGEYSPVRVQEIIADALANGEGFVPGCGGDQVVVLKPVLVGCDPDTLATAPVTQVLVIEVPITCDDPGPGTGTPGYWGNHPEAWPVDQITIGGIVYTKDQAIANIKKSISKDKRWTMFASLVCAKLNVLIGNEDDCIADVIIAADAWWATYGGNKVTAKSAAWNVGEPLHTEMDLYNNGLLCAPARD